MGKVEIHACRLSRTSKHSSVMLCSSRQGKRLTVPAFPGQNLVEVARTHDVELDGPCSGLGAPTAVLRSETWTEDVFGEGPKCYCCHVMIPEEFQQKMDPPFQGELELLEQLDDLNAPGASRLGCQVKLTKELDGITVFIPDGPPTDGV
ncbi:unnamed protein product [Discosporangium mesarthrocarpum]